MNIQKGSRRIVFVFPALGFVIKLPRIFIGTVLRHTFNAFNIKEIRKSSKRIYREFKYPMEVRGLNRDLLCKGLYDNWHEYLFYRETYHVFVLPTYFSLFGLLNIQKYGKQQEMSLGFIFGQFKRITDEEVVIDGHHFIEWKNFCIEGGKIKILDYGSVKTQYLIWKWGEKMMEEFNPDEPKDGKPQKWKTEHENY